MAIKIAKETYQGITLPEAYVRLTELKTSRNSVEMQFAVYASQQAFQEGKPHVELIHKELGERVPEIPAVEAVDEVLDEEGNVVTPAVEGVEGVPAVPGFEDYFGIDILDGQTNPIRQSYLYLMSLEEFKTGTEI